MPTGSEASQHFRFPRSKLRVRVALPASLSVRACVRVGQISVCVCVWGGGGGGRRGYM